MDTQTNIPLISIIIPVFNTAQFIEECICSISRQTYKNIEIICVDDGSSDNSLDILTSLQTHTKNIYIYKQSHKGQSAARNLGFTKARGKYVAFIDADDKIEKNTLEDNIPLLEQHSLDACLFNMLCFYPDFTQYICFDASFYKQGLEFCNPQEKDNSIQFTNAAPAIFNANFLRENNIKFIEGMIYEDWVFMSQVMCCATKICISSVPYYHYRRGFALTTTSLVDTRCLDLFKAYYAAKENIKQHNLSHIFDYTNDKKILKEASSFFINNLQTSNDKKIKQIYLSEFTKIIASFNDTYLLGLTSQLSPMEKHVVTSIKENNLWKIYTRNYETYKKRCSQLIAPINKCIKYFLLPFSLIKHIIKLLILRKNLPKNKQ